MANITFGFFALLSYFIVFISVVDIILGFAFARTEVLFWNIIIASCFLMLGLYLQGLIT